MEFSQSAWGAIAFILFFILVGKRAYQVLTSVLDNKKKLIEDELNHAIKLREQAQMELNDSIKKQKQITIEIEKILNEAKETSDKIRLEAEEKVLDMIKRKEEQANQKINASQTDAINQIKNLISKIAIHTSETYIKENIDDKSSKKLFRDTNNELMKKL